MRLRDRKQFFFYRALSLAAGAALVIMSVIAIRIHGHAPKTDAVVLAAQDNSHANDNNAAQSLLQSYRHVEVASVSDAVEQLLGKRMYLSHRMHPLFHTKFVGFALTVRLKKEENRDPHALDGMLVAIDHGKKGSVYVMSIEDGVDIAGMGGLMGTAMQSRDFSGALIDGAVRDTDYLRKIGFPVYAAGVTPSTSVGHYRFGGSQIAVVIDGVTINPGDVITADNDGVVVVPRGKAAAVLELAQQMDYKEHSMYPLIEKTKSIEGAVKQVGRL